MSPLRSASVVHLVLLVAPGCFVHVDASPESEVVDLDQPFTSVSFDIESGDLEVRHGDTARVERTWWGRRPGFGARVTDGVLDLEMTCPGVGACRTEHVVYLPEGVAIDGYIGSGDIVVKGALSVDVETASGDVQVSEIDGDVRIATGSGDVWIGGAGGDVDVLAESGDVLAQQLWSLHATLETGSGDVQVQMADVPAHLGVLTGSGDVKVDLVDGVYDVRTRTGAGAVQVSVKDDPDAEHVVDLETGSGDILVSSY